MAPVLAAGGSRYFYPRSPCGERLDSSRAANCQQHFYPRSPCGERQESQRPCGHPTKDFYPRSPCGERQALSLLGWLRVLISIHALLAESDIINNVIDGANKIFLSTLSLRRATREPTALRTPHHNFYPRSPCGERRSEYR